MPHTDQGLPFSGTTPISRHASYTGALAAAEKRAKKTARYIELLKQYGSLSDQAVQALTTWPLSSVNSIRNGLGDLVVADPEKCDTQKCGSRTTTRTRWMWVGK